MAEPIIELRDLHGPFRGLVRPYLRSAGENAIATGFAERVEAAGEAPSAPPASPTTEVASTERLPPAVQQEDETKGSRRRRGR